jgi:hypothetical protein
MNAPNGRRSGVWNTGQTGDGRREVWQMMTSPEPTELARDFWAAGYAAIDG